MKKTICILICIIMYNYAYAQKTQTEVTKPTTEYDDSKPNSEDVSEVITQASHFERIIIVRLKYKTDLLEGLRKAVEKEKIRNAVILAGIGSVRNYHVHTVSNRDFPSKNFYIKDPTCPADIQSLNGYIIDGRVHAHITLCDDEKSFGGHLELETNIFTFAIVTIGVFSEDINLSRFDDKTYR